MRWRVLDAGCCGGMVMVGPIGEVRFGTDLRMKKGGRGRSLPAIDGLRLGV